MPVETSIYGKTRTGETVTSYHLYNEHMEIELIDYGATLIHVWFRDKKWRFRDVVLGYDDLEGYENDTESIGSVVGRNANRIEDGILEIDGQIYKLETNDRGLSNLHSGTDRYKNRIWDAWTDVEDRDASVTFILKSQDNDQGFPGNAKIFVTYTLTDDNTIRIDYKAKSDKKTIFNLTNHTYFNLNGDKGAKALNHVVQMKASRYTELDERSVPTGNLPEVDGTPFDFRTPMSLEEGLKKGHPQLSAALGYDHSMILDQPSLDDPSIVFYSPDTGIECSVYTTAPCVQLYTGNYLNVEKGRGGVPYSPQDAVCFETQGYLDSTHHENFPSNLYEADSTYKSTTIFSFDLHEEPDDETEE